MMSLYDDTEPVVPLNRVWRGIVHKAPNDVNDLLDITIPDLGAEILFNQVKWQSRDAISLPSPGDPCLVIFDNDREPWVVAWWPF